MSRKRSLLGGTWDIGAAFVFIGLANLMHFLFQVVVGRYVSPAQFSSLAILLLGLTLTTVVSSGFQSETVHAGSPGSDALPFTGHFGFDQLAKQGAGYGFLLAIILMALSPLLSVLLNQSTALILIVALAFPFSFLSSVASGRLQGAGLIRLVALIGLLSSLLKLTIGLVAIELGTTAEQLIAAVIGGTFIASILTLVATRSRGLQDYSLRRGRLVKLSAIQTLFWLVLNMDVFLSRFALGPTDGGIYAAAASFAKLSVLGPSLIGLAILPRLIGRMAHGRSAVTPLFVSLASAGIMAVASFLFFLFFGATLLELLFGSEYQAPPDLLAGIALAVIPISVSQVGVQMLLVNPRTKTVAVLGICLGTAVSGLLFASGSLGSYLLIYGLSGTITLFCILALSVSALRREHASD